MAKGTVVMLARGAQFGFVRVDGTKSDAFFHRESIATDDDFERIELFDRVEFDTAPDPKKPGKCRAVNVRLI
jgi:cold shock CspA family protein